MSRFEIPPALTGSTTDEAERPTVEAIIVNDCLLPFVRWLLDADGRGAFNRDAIAARVVALGWLLDPAILHGANERELADQLGVCKQKLSRAVGDIVEQLGLSNASTGEFQRAARKSARRFGALTSRKKRNDTLTTRV